MAQLSKGVEQTFTDSLNDPVGRISGCWFYIDGQFEKAANFLPIPCENGAACTISVNHQFLSTGDYSVRFSCRDAANNVGWGSPVTVSVSESHAPIITSLDYYSCHSTTPEQECTDQFACCTEPTTQTDCDVKFNISAYDPDGNPLTYTWDFNDGTPNSNDEDPSHHYTSANTYNVLVDVFDGTEHSQDILVVTVSNPSLLVGLTANPSFGTDSLENVDLRALVSGSMYGAINYKFDCTNDGGWELEVSGQSINDYTAVDVCSYLTPASSTAKTFVQRGTGSAEDTVNINVVASECTPGEQTDCTSAQGCVHTITCQADATWPSCPTDECVQNSTQNCGDCGEQTCSLTCSWGVCEDEGECTPSPDCPDCLCPPDTCVGQDYYDYPDFGDCNASCACDTGIETGQPCEPIIIINDPQCNEAPICDSLSAVPDQGVAPLDVLFTGSAHDDDGTIANYGFIFEDGESGTTTENSINYTYNTPGTYCAKLRVQDNDGTWSSIPGDCPDICAKQINVSENIPPEANVSCDASGCGAGSACNGTWIAYNRNCQFYFLNDSTDLNSTNPPDNNNDIIKSTWSIFYESGTPWQDPYVICTDVAETPENEAICDLLMPSLPVSQNYYITLTVEDTKGATDSYNRSFYVRRELAADFQCSLNPEEGWQSCNGFVASEEEMIYFKDISIPSEGSTGISSWSWIFEDGIPSTSNLQNPSASFMNVDANSGATTLDAVDNVGRTDTEQYQLQITIPLPEWYEVVPF
jgi:PKD repeat protein